MKIVRAGKPISEAAKVLIMVHGRGSTAEDVLRLSEHLDLEKFAVIAPQANNNTWYPLSFLAPIQTNEPFVSNSLETLEEIEKDLCGEGFSSEKIFFFGFSQGACLVLEYVTRNAKRYGGVVAIIGGLIGYRIATDNYKTEFKETPVFIGTNDPDDHVPLERVEETVKILKEKGADVRLEVYKNKEHVISMEEIEIANSFIFNAPLPKKKPE